MAWELSQLTSNRESFLTANDSSLCLREVKHFSMHGSRVKMNAPRALEQHTEKCYNSTMHRIGNLADFRLLLTLILIQKPGGRSVPYLHQISFIDSALLEVAQNSEENQTILLCTAGLTEQQINDASISGGRRKDKITGVAWFSHGLNDYTIPLGYGLDISRIPTDSDIVGMNSQDIKNLVVNIDTVNNMNKNAFDNAVSIFYLCNTGVGKRNSFAQAWSNRTGGHTIAAVRRTDYSYISGIGIHNFWKYFNWEWEGFMDFRRTVAAGRGRDKYEIPFPAFSMPRLSYKAKFEDFYPSCEE